MIDNKCIDEHNLSDKDYRQKMLTMENISLDEKMKFLESIYCLDCGLTLKQISEIKVQANNFFNTSFGEELHKEHPFYSSLNTLIRENWE